MGGVEIIPDPHAGTGFHTVALFGIGKYQLDAVTTRRVAAIGQSDS